MIKLDSLNTDVRIQRFCHNHRIAVQIDAHVWNGDKTKEGIGVQIKRLKSGGLGTAYIITEKEMIASNKKFEDFIFQLIIDMEKELTEAEGILKDDGKRIILN